MRCAHDPARFRSRGDWRCRDPQHQRGDAGGLRGQRQFAAGDEIELARLAPDLEHDGTERIAGERVGRGAQAAVDIGSAHRDQEARIEAELGEPAHRQRAVLAIGKSCRTQTSGLRADISPASPAMNPVAAPP